MFPSHDTQPYEQLSLSLLSRIESNSIFTMLLWQMFEKQRIDKERAHHDIDDEQNKQIYGEHHGIGGIGKMLNDIEDNINMFNLKYNPIL